MNEFILAEIPQGQLDPIRYMTRFAVSFVEALRMVEQVASEALMVNGEYQVQVSTPFDPKKANWPSMVHLTITRNDMQPIVSWADKQEIKNKIIGNEYEAIEIFPAESRLVDMGNQYHLWVFSDPTFRVPIGWTTRMVDKETPVVQVPEVVAQQPSCAVCGEDAITGSGYNLCPSHYALFMQDYVALIEISGYIDTPSGRKVKSTGNVCHIPRPMVATLLGHGIEDDLPLAYVEVGIIDQVQELHKSLESQSLF